ncbi:hypothetical protein GCM10011352_19000 [Marinobacterium zhoushanense]|uniref:Ankyrin repeat protein n=1 Tax=Marinobacterium zhoushanense TaxID=1679163 RepID=A0ABQ1K9T6_9GAMM|nr:ankyrin repeat domain-containing protein [Marinobacterium zhoushanense]GGB93145.1 hypothetical protein GCM10011352_19000 [Marinobacterium zhoushanense]
MADPEWFTEHRFDMGALDTPNADGEYALILAARQGKDKLVSELIALGTDTGVVDQYGNNAVWAACYAESEATIRELIKSGCDLDYRNPSGNTVMAYAASSGKDAVVHLLLELGADPNIRNDDDMSPLDLAASLTSFKLLRAVRA